MNCPQCHAVVPAGAQVCPNCQTVLPPETREVARPPVSNDGPSLGLGLLGFFIPLIGAIVWLSMRPTSPRKARSAGVGALAGFLATCILFGTVTYAVQHYGKSMLTTVAKGNRGTPVKTLPGQSASTPAAAFAQIAFTSLSHGETTAESYLDWQSLNTAGTDVSTFYLVMPGDEAKASFRKSFITSFAKSFREKGATAESFSNWRTESQSSTQAVVTATVPSGRVFVLTLSNRDGFWRISKIDFR